MEDAEEMSLRSVAQKRQSVIKTDLDWFQPRAGDDSQFLLNEHSTSQRCF